MHRAGVDCETITVCRWCRKCLRRGKVPPCSLVRLDTGPWPEDAHGPLPVPTFVEATILAPFRPLRTVMACGSGGWHTACKSVAPELLKRSALTLYSHAPLCLRLSAPLSLLPTLCSALTLAPCPNASAVSKRSALTLCSQARPLCLTLPAPLSTRPKL